MTRAFGMVLPIVFAVSILALAHGAGAAGATPPVAPGQSADAGAEGTRSSPPQRRVLLLGLRPRGNLARLGRRVADPADRRFRDFPDQAEFRERFAARRSDRRRLRRYLDGRRGVKRLELNSTQTTALVVMTPPAARRTFCAAGAGSPSRGLCLPARLRRPVRQISAGERYVLGSIAEVPDPASPRAKIANDGTPKGCAKAVATGAYTPNQLATAYEVDPLHAEGLRGRGIRVATLAGQRIEGSSIRTWAECFGMPEPKVRPVRMPSSVPSTQVPSDEEYLDIEALATLAPRLGRITPIAVPLDQNFSHSLPLFLFGVLDRSRQDGRLPHVLSISDGVCESRFTADQLALSQRLLREASVLGISALAASGDLGFLGCQVSERNAGFPDSSRFVAGVGGTALSVTPANEIADQVVWSTFGDPDENGVGSGGGPSGVWARPGFQTGPGIGPDLQSGDPTRLTPDISANGSFTPGIAIFDATQRGWGADGGTSAATPLAAAIVALVRERERRAGRPALGSLPPLLYSLARGPGYASVFFDVTEGTSSPKPDTPLGQSPAGGAAQPGYDLATGLGTLRAEGFAEAVAATPPGS